MTTFVETPRFPEFIAYGAVGGPGYKTDIVEVDSGGEQRNPRWDQARARYTVEMPLVDPNRATLIAFFRAMKGRAYGFRLKDWSDYQCDLTNGTLGLSVPTGLPTYQLYKLYSQGLTEYRLIKKPVSGQVAVYRGGVLQTLGAGAGNYAVDTTTGIVTFVADATANVNAVTISATPVITLASALSGLAIGGKLYLTGLGGTVGNVLNGLAHSVTNVSGAQYTISTSTVGLAYTSGGSGRKYPQPSETLAWVGEFDVPVRFDNDELQLTIEKQQVYRAQQIALVEIRPQ
jgi:uncharacterized protein (TIGR02217 family)